MAVVFAFDIFGSSELLVLAVVAVLLYGERLPEVARSWGKQFTDFKKGLDGIRREFESAVHSASGTATQSPVKEEAEEFDREEATAPKFEPPPGDNPPSDTRPNESAQ